MQEKGFTLIEILVVIAILVIFPTIVISDFPQIRRQFALSGATHTFAQNMRKAQDLALSSIEYKDQNEAPQPVSGYGVYVDVNGFSNKKYIVYADKSPGNRQYDVLDYIVATVDFSASDQGVIIREVKNVFNSKASVNFSPPNPNTTIDQLNQGQNNIEVVFALESNLATTRSVLVNTAGLIEIK